MSLIPFDKLDSWRAPEGTTRILCFLPGEPHSELTARWLYRVVVLTTPDGYGDDANIWDLRRWSATERMKGLIESIAQNQPRPYLDLRVTKVGQGIDQRLTVVDWDAPVLVAVDPHRLAKAPKRRIRVDFTEPPKPPPPVVLPIPWDEPPPKVRAPRKRQRRSPR